MPHLNLGRLRVRPHLRVLGAEVVELRESEELALETVAEPSVLVEEGGDWVE